MTLKEKLEKIWKSSPCQVPLDLCQWLDIGLVEWNLVAVNASKEKVRIDNGD